MQINYIWILIVAKVFVASLTLYFFAIYLGWNMFKYPDFHSSYSNCIEMPNANILYTKLFCVLSSITGKVVSYDSAFFVSLAAFINMLILIGYYRVCQKYLNKYGKYLLIILFVTHPYMNIYFFRFYTDLFASLGIFLIIFYKMKGININISFVIFALILMNFRVALIPVFLIYGLWEIYSQYLKNNYKALFFSILLVLFSFLSYLPAMEFSSSFASINSDINFIEKISSNIIFAFGYRESIGISRDIFILDNWIDVLSFIVSLILLTIHAIGLYGVIKFSLKKDLSILIIFVYLLMPIFAVAHMRYLMPIIPILLFGFTYLFFSINKTKQIS